MGILTDIRRALVGDELAALSEQLRASDANLALLQEQLVQETLAELELSIEDKQWISLSKVWGDFDRRQLKDIWDLSRLMYLKNPLINRAVNLQAYYVWGQGVQIEAKSALVNERVQAFLDAPRNTVELTGHQARTLKESDLQVYGNLFFVLFTDKVSGAVTVRSIPADEVTDIICNPEDRKEPWYYKREWSQSSLDPASGVVAAKYQIAYYPDWRYRPGNGKPETIGASPVQWDTPVYHLRIGGLSDMKFGVPEVYQAIDWARAYKSFLEDWATIVRAYARFAWQMRTPNKAGVAAAKAKFGTTLGTGGTSSETNPPPVTGSMFVGREGYELQPVRTSGATTSAEDGRRLLLMVCAATGMPESFFGDVSVGTLATAKSLDRPTELKFSDRRSLWADVLGDILQYVVDAALAAATNPLPEIDPETGEDIDRHIDISFPPILEHSITESVGAIVSAATLDGKAPAGTIPDTKMLSRMLLTALGAQDVDELLEQLFPEDQQTPPVEAMTEAVRELRAALMKVAA